ncbi:MAG: hypothetical protein JXB39_16920 [Deltaproteobacteria bacterium]|nr:hypothetical protein [Deltaproteobacteria bacterium]
MRGGVVLQENATGGEPLPGGRSFVPLAWTPGETVEIGGDRFVAPLQASCVPLLRHRLGNVSRAIALGAEAPDTALAWSPDGSRLAVGTRLGTLLLIDPSTGEVTAERDFPEAVVKRVAWSARGDVLYAGEQSPDAFLHALDPRTLDTRWSLRLADEVGTSPAPPGDDLYGIYTLPGVYGLEVLPDGALLVSAVHGWNDTHGARCNRSRLLVLDPSGNVLAAWPRENAADATLMHPRVDASGRLAAVPVGRSAEGPPPADLPVHGVQILTLPDLEPAAAFVPPPLEPWFDSVFAWEAVDVSARLDRVLLGLGDGRLFVVPIAQDAAPLRLDLGTPVVSGGVPLAASVGFGFFHQDTLVSQTARSNIPYGNPIPDVRPAWAHPAENAIRVHDLEGRLQWEWRGPHALAGLSLGPGDLLVAGAGPRVADDRRDLFGALLFRLDGEGTGYERLVTACPTSGPVFIHHALSAQGLLAVAAFPFLGGDGALEGDYEVVVFR